ncbi:hypothetical protein D2E30_23840, partial [Mycobacteroides abscessus]
MGRLIYYSMLLAAIVCVTMYHLTCRHAIKNEHCIAHTRLSRILFSTVLYLTVIWLLGVVS